MNEVMIAEWSNAKGPNDVLYTASALVPANGREPQLSVTVRVRESEGRWEPVYVSVLSGAGITTLRGEDLRRVPLAQICSDAEEAVFEHQYRYGELDPLMTNLKPRRGRRPKPLRFFAQVAAEFCDLCASTVGPTGPRPIAALAEQRNVSRAAVKKWVTQARHLELLTSPPKGARTGGQLTDRAKEILDGAR